MSGSTTHQLTGQQIARLHADLILRDDLFRWRARHSFVALELELGLSRVTIWKINAGSATNTPPQVIHEVKTRNVMWRAANCLLRPLTRAALMNRHQICEHTLDRHIRAVRLGAAQRTREAA